MRLAVSQKVLHRSLVDRFAPFPPTASTWLACGNCYGIKSAGEAGKARHAAGATSSCNTSTVARWRRVDGDGTLSTLRACHGHRRRCHVTPSSIECSDRSGVLKAGECQRRVDRGTWGIFTTSSRFGLYPPDLTSQLHLHLSAGLHRE